jgi:hypothetical protein
MTTLTSALETVTPFWLVTRLSKVISDNDFCTDGSHWAMSSPHLWSVNSKTNEIASIVLVSSESIWDTELCSAFHASCSLDVAPLAPAWSPGVE